VAATQADTSAWTQTKGGEQALSLLLADAAMWLGWGRSKDAWGSVGKGKGQAGPCLGSRHGVAHLVACMAGRPVAAICSLA